MFVWASRQNRGKSGNEYNSKKDPPSDRSTGEMFVIQKGRREKCVSDNNKGIRTSEGVGG
jgi:hypothetical protein